MKIETTRRKALAIFGFGAVSAPLAAKEAADAELLKLAKIGGSLFSPTPDVYSGAPQGSLDYDAVQSKASAFFELFGLPKHIEENYESRAREIHALDYDIAAKRSWSLAYKVTVQRERNLQKMRERMKTTFGEANARKVFKAVNGFDWPFYF